MLSDPNCIVVVDATTRRVVGDRLADLERDARCADGCRRGNVDIGEGCGRPTDLDLGDRLADLA